MIDISWVIIKIEENIAFKSSHIVSYRTIQAFTCLQLVDTNARRRHKGEWIQHIQLN